jgi:hypothetical protein
MADIADIADIAGIADNTDTADSLMLENSHDGMCKQSPTFLI